MKKTARAAVIRLHALARLAGANILGDLPVLSDPECQAANQRPRLGSPEVATQRTVVALVEYLVA